MSQIVTQKKLLRLEVAPALEIKDVIDISALVREVKSEITTAVISDPTRGDIKSPNSEMLLVSPMELKKSFKESYEYHLNELNSDNTLIKQKTALVKTLQETKYKVKEKVAVQKLIDSTLKTNSIKEFSRKVNGVMNEIQDQHSEILIKNVASHIKEASISTGFAADIRIKSAAEKITIVSHQGGKAILSEIKVDKMTKRIDMSTETIGFEGESCDVVMKKFQNELSKRGLKFSNLNKKWTGGAGWLDATRRTGKKVSLIERVESTKLKRMRKADIHKQSTI